MFLLRAFFWLAIIAFLLPIGDREPSRSVAADGYVHPAAVSEEPTFEVADAVRIVVSTGADVLSFCERNPATCTAAVDGLAVLKQQLTEAAGALQEWIADRASEAQEDPSAAI